MPSPIPLEHYNPRVTSPIELATARALLDTGRIAAIKDSSGDWPHFELLLDLKHHRPFALFAGNDRIAARALRAEADGVISAAACAVPEWFTQLAPEALGNRASPNLPIGSDASPNLVAIKRAVALRGQKSEPLNLLRPETTRALEEFAAWFRQNASKANA